MRATCVRARRAARRRLRCRVGAGCAVVLRASLAHEHRLEGQHRERPRIAEAHRERHDAARAQDGRHRVQVVERRWVGASRSRRRCARAVKEDVRAVDVQRHRVVAPAVAHEVEHVLREDPAPPLRREEKVDGIHLVARRRPADPRQERVAPVDLERVRRLAPQHARRQLRARQDVALDRRRGHELVPRVRPLVDAEERVQGVGLAALRPPAQDLRVDPGRYMLAAARHAMVPRNPNASAPTTARSATAPAAGATRRCPRGCPGVRRPWRWASPPARRARRRGAPPRAGGRGPRPAAPVRAARRPGPPRWARAAPPSRRSSPSCGPRRRRAPPRVAGDPRGRREQEAPFASGTHLIQLARRDDEDLLDGVLELGESARPGARGSACERTPRARRQADGAVPPETDAMGAQPLPVTSPRISTSLTTRLPPP